MKDTFGIDALRMLKSIRNCGLLGVESPGQHGAHRRQEFAVELLAERIAPDQPVRLDRDVDDADQA